MSVRERPFLRQVRHVHPDVRDPRTSAVRQQIRRDFGILVPPFALHLPAPDALCAYWAIAREPTHGRRVDRAKKEAVAAAVSATNTCPYCVDVHTTMLHALGGRAAAAAIASGQPDSITDPDLHAIATWARANREPTAPILRQRPFPDEHAPELIGVALAYHYINRMVNIFAAASPFPSAAPKIRPIMRRAASPFFRRLLARDVHPGASLDLLPPAPLPDDLGWAQSDPIIADAFGRAAAAFDSIGQQALPEPVRQLVTARLGAWRGEEPGLSRSWVERAIETLPAPQRPQGRLALLAALASYQVDAQVLDDARTSPGPVGDEALVAAAGWASFAAARRIGSWLHTAPATTTSGRDLTS
jgi:AhpD family alkylhydroperoxidase